MEYNSYMVLFMFNLFLYSLSFILMIFRFNYTSISIRSPNLSIISIISSFLLSSSLISYELIEDYDNISDYYYLFCKILPLTSILFHLIIFFTLSFRLSRIIYATKINNLIVNLGKSLPKNYSKCPKLNESFYIKYLFVIISTLILVFSFLLFKLKNSKIVLPYFCSKCYLDLEPIEFNKPLLIFNITYFTESIILLYQQYEIIFSSLNKLIKIEFTAQILTHISLFHLVKYTNLNNDEPFHINVMILIIFLYINNSFFISIVPFIYSLIDKVNIIYQYNPKISTDLYVFLSDELCYFSFFNFMKRNQRDHFYICLYTEIMKYKFKYSLESDYYKVLDIAKNVYNNFFSIQYNGLFRNEDLLQKVRGKFGYMITNNDCSYEMFDDALFYVFEYLNEKFKVFKGTEEYYRLMGRLNLNFYVHYQMCDGE